MAQRKQNQITQAPPAAMVACLQLPDLAGVPFPEAQGKSGFPIVGGAALLPAVPRVSGRPVILQPTILVPAALAAQFQGLIGKPTTLSHHVRVEWMKIADGDHLVPLASLTLTDSMLEVRAVRNDKAGAKSLVLVALDLSGVVHSFKENGGSVSVGNEPTSS